MTAKAGGSTRTALEVLHQDRWLAVVDKPPGLMVHDSRLARGERDFAADRLRQQFGRRIHLVHRLDRPSSGCLLLAFDQETARHLGKQLMARELERRYLAVCRGWPAETQFVIDRPLDGGPGRPEERAARTGIRVLGTGELDAPSAGFQTSRHALLECRLETGRFHQIRRHLRHVRHPLVGDTTHGDNHRNRIFRLRGVRRMLLHAHRLAFEHPVEGGQLEIEAPLDAEFMRVMEWFGWSLEERAAGVPYPS